MRRFIITGAPGAGKTTVIRQLELDGFNVVEEAATDVIAVSQAQGIAEPWTEPRFIDTIAKLQKQRQMRAYCRPDQIQFHDRSAICTAALAEYLGYQVTPILACELERIKTESVFEKLVFFMRNLGFIQPNEARRITFEESLRFEQIHEDTYRRFGFELVFVKPGSVLERVSFIKAAIARPGV